MSQLLYNNAKLWVAQYDFSAWKNRLNLQYGADMLDDTVMGDTTRSMAGGLKTVQLDAGGLFDTADNGLDEQYFNNIGVADKPISLAAEGGDEGEVGYAFKSILAQYQPGAAVGELLAFTITAHGTGDLVRGTIMQNGSETTTTSCTNRQLGAVSASQKLYAVMHITAVSGTNPTLDVLVRSAAADGMAGATTRITFTQATGITSQWATPVTGAIADTWWDVSWSLGGTNTPTFAVVVIVGIQ